jgi:hypothetical protein
LIERFRDVRACCLEAVAQLDEPLPPLFGVREFELPDGLALKGENAIDFGVICHDLFHSCCDFRLVLQASIDAPDRQATSS